MRFAGVLAFAIGFGSALPARGQAPPASPLVLSQPATPRTAALGNAWVAGRDHEVVFYNPAQLIGSRPEFDLSMTRFGSDRAMTTLGSTYAAGNLSLTLGWGVQVLRFGADAGGPYPYPADAPLTAGSSAAYSSLFVVGAAVAVKGFRVGVAGKGAWESGPASPADGSGRLAHRGALVTDLGLAHDLWGGVAAASLQNLGGGADDQAGLALPTQALAGWSTTRQAGPLDLGIFTQVTVRDGWTSPGAGLEAGYSWIDGFNVALRIGARRPESSTEHPLALGASFTADRLTIEYALRTFDGGLTANGVTLRWR